MTDNVPGAWRGAVFHKSSYSAQDGQCVEVARSDAMFGLRDSKNPVGPVLAVPGQWGHAFLMAIQREQITGT
jgi:hypothetical protein